jgi:outer membrane receptor for ferrienterochelin and colicin
MAQSGKIAGRVLDVNTNEPLPFINVVVWGTSLGASTDDQGNFLISGVTPGYVEVAATAVGYEPYLSDVLYITNARTTYLEIRMIEKSIQLSEVVVRASPFHKYEESPLSMRNLDISEIERYPGGNRDISKVIQALPGISSTVSYRNDIIVRGGGPSENAFYIDGIEIPTLNHFSTQGASGGPTGIINVDFIREVDVYSGAFPANRGGSLSSVMEFEQVDANREKLYTRASLGASDMAFSLEGPVSDKSGLILSVRRSYLQLLFSALKLPFLPTYNDYQLKYKFRFDNKNELSMVSLGALDQFRLNTGLKNPDESQRYILGYLPVIEQFSYIFGTNYRHYNNKGFGQLVVSRNYLHNRIYKYLNNDESNENSRLNDYVSTEAENKIRYENSTRRKDFKIIYGAGGEYARYTNDTWQRLFVAGQAGVLDYDSFLEVYKWEAFGQVSKPLLKSRLTLSLGVRFDGNDYTPYLSNPLHQSSPRVSASFSLTEKWSLNFNMGRYYQLPSYTTLGYKDSLGTFVNKKYDLRYISADHLVAGVEYSPNENSRFTLEGFYKRYGNYPVSVLDSISLANKGGDYGTSGDEEVVSTGKGRAYGLELLYRNKSFSNFNVIFSYTLVRSEFTGFSGQYIPSAWDNRHIINATVLREFKRHLDIGLKWRFVGGTPYTPYDMDKSGLRAAWDARNRGYPDFSLFNSLRSKAFHRLDVRVDKKYFFDKWTLRLYLDIENLYNFKSEEQDFLTNLDEQGVPVIVDESLPYNEQRYVLRTLKNESGTLLPSIGVIVEF